MTRPGAWRPVQARGRSHHAPAPDTARAPVRYDPPADEPRLVETPQNGSRALATCIFCQGPSAEVAYAWPDWVCRFLAEHQGMWCPASAVRGADLVMVERAEREADKTVACVCRTCREGWILRLEDNVSPFLKPMILGDPTPLPAARRKLLARWAAKTAMLIECASDSSLRTPSFASEHLRNVGVHPGTQVLVGRYDGQLQMLTSERDVFPRVVGGEQRHLSQTSLVMGNVLVQVYADPWRDHPPELTENAVAPFIPIIGNHSRRVLWPPDVVVDDALYDLVRLGSTADARAPQGSREVQGGHDVIMTNTDIDGEPPSLSAAEAELSPTAPDDSGTEPAPKRRRPALAYAAVALLVVVGLLGFGVRQRSDAARARTKSATTQRRNSALESAIRIKTQQLRASQTRVDQLDARVAALASGKRVGTSVPDLLKLVDAVPSATDGLRRCAGSALTTASDALEFAASYPTSATRVNAAATAVATVCGQASDTANTLDTLADAVQR